MTDNPLELSTSSNEVEAHRAAENQSLFREVNERIEELNQQFATLSPMGDWVCECANDECFAPISMTIAEYEAIRTHPARFPVLVGHERPDLEVVVETHDRYVVVEKVGEARHVATSRDPRKN